MLDCGGGGAGLETLCLVVSRLRLGAALIGGGGMEVAVLFGLEVASRGCLEAGRFEPTLATFGAGVADAPLDSPIVIRMNSLIIPSSL